HGRANGHVKDRLGFGRIDEIDGPALKNEALVVEEEVAAGQVDASEHNWLRRRSRDPQVHRSGETQLPVHQIDAVRRLDRELQLHVVAEALRWWHRNCSAEASHHAGEIEVRRERQLVKADLPAQQRLFRRASQEDLPTDSGANAVRIEQADSPRLHGHIELQAGPVKHSAGGADRASTNVRVKAGDLQAIARERQHSVTVGEPERHVARCKRSVDDFYLSLHVRICELTEGIDVELQLTGGHDVGIEELQQLQVNRAQQ